MVESPEPGEGAPRPRLSKEYEDPHFHDEDEVGGTVSEDTPRRSTSPPSAKPARKLPPPPRRFHED